MTLKEYASLCLLMEPPALALARVRHNDAVWEQSEPLLCGNERCRVAEYRADERLCFMCVDD